MKRVLFTALFFMVLAGAYAGYLYSRWQQPLAIPAGGYRLLVASGDSLRTVADALSAQQILANPQLLLIYGRYTGLDQQIKKGEYFLPEGTTAQSLLSLLHSGRVIQYMVTLPEGITLVHALSILAQQKPLRHVLSGPRDQKILAIAAPHATGEGLFFPDSYLYERGTSDWQIMRRAHQKMTEVLAEEWAQREPDLPYESPYEALIMASIIERETGLASERARIAGVFVRRLVHDMRLQTDPTVIYGLGENFNGNLQRQHLADKDNPYNSYRHRGLPPTPIALPGRDSIHAALHPAPGKALYFVARGDGGHEFSATLAEHQRAVRKYQYRRKENYRSSPAKQ